MWASPEKDDDEQLEALAAFFSNDSDSLLRKSQVKIYSDGLLGSTTAAMLQKYNVDLGILPENKGVLI
jgi:predicted amidohydrolase YtcJ